MGVNLGPGREALARGDWLTAKKAFSSALEDSSSPEALDGLGLSLWWLKRPIEGIEARARAYVGYREAGRFEEAARVAVWLAREERTLFDNAAAADGWLARASSLGDRLSDTSVPGWVLVARAGSLRDISAATDLCAQALAIARGHDDADLEILCLSRLGVMEIASGSIEAGVVHLDEAMAAAAAGEGADRQTIGEAYCSLMEAGDLLGDMERVTSWSATVDRFKEVSDLGPLAMHGSVPVPGALSAFCGSCCGGIYMVTGRLDEAERELVDTIAELQTAGMRSRCVHPVTQLAELRVVQGRLEEARLLLAEYEDLPESVRPLALVDVALGDAAGALDRLRTRIRELADLPTVAFPLWVVMVDAALACEALGAATEAVDDIQQIAALTGSSRHEGYALLARGKLAAARDDQKAPVLLRAAGKQLSAATLPLMALRARMELARSLVDTERATAISEARAAVAAFERMGAGPDADAAAAFLRDLGVKGRTGAKDVGLLTKRETQVLRLVGQGLSNAEIAERLFISVKTAGHHVSSILSKLRLRSRTEAAAYAALHLGPEPVGK